MVQERLRLLVALALGAVLGFLLKNPISLSAPYTLAVEATASVWDNLIKPRIREPRHDRHYYRKSRFEKTGVIAHDARRAFSGVTLFSASGESAAYLIDMHGRRLREWRLPFAEAWPAAPHLEVPVPDSYVFFRTTHLFSNGDLLAIYEAPGHWPYAYGLARLDRSSRLVWKYSDLANHDLDVGPDGRIYTLVHQVRELPIAGLDPFPGQVVIDDVLAVLGPDGSELERVSLIDALLKSPYAPILLRDGRKKDVLHTNSVHVATASVAEGIKGLREGQVLVSFKSKSAIAILDVPSGEIVWLRRGSWRQQHAARFLGDGKIGLFDNEGNVARGGRSRIVEIDFEDGRDTWIFAGDERFEFDTPWRGSYQKLPNGNRLVTESDAGHVFEVTPDKVVVWEYVLENQVDGKTPAVFSAQRFSRDELEFLEPTP